MIKSQYPQAIEFIKKHFPSSIQIETKSSYDLTDGEYQSKNEETSEFQVQEMVINNFISAMGLVVVKLTLGWNGPDDGKKINIFFMTEDESKQLEQNKKKYLI